MFFVNLGYLFLLIPPFLLSFKLIEAGFFSKKLEHVYFVIISVLTKGVFDFKGPVYRDLRTLVP